MASPPTNYHCPKCGHRACDTGEMHVAGGMWSKIFNVEGRKLTTVTCAQCKYTELFAVDSSKLQNVFDFIVN